jgi:hypothetical protein
VYSLCIVSNIIHIKCIQDPASTVQLHMDSSTSAIRLCTKPWCKQSIPSNSTFKNCKHCRELDRINQQAHRTKKIETKTSIQHTTTGQKRRIDKDLHSGRPCHRSKIHDNPKETEDKDVFQLDGIDLKDIAEPNETVSTLNLKDRKLLRIKPNTGSK